MNDNKEGKCDNCGNSLGKKGSDESYSREVISYCKNGGKTYSFCSSKCSEKFLGKPAKDSKSAESTHKTKAGWRNQRGERKCDACGKPLWKKHGKGYTSVRPIFSNSKTGKEYCLETCQNNDQKNNYKDSASFSPSQPNVWIIAFIAGAVGMIGIIIYNVWRKKK